MSALAVWPKWHWNSLCIKIGYNQTHLMWIKRNPLPCYLFVVEKDWINHHHHYYYNAFSPGFLRTHQFGSNEEIISSLPWVRELGGGPSVRAFGANWQDIWEGASLNACRWLLASGNKPHCPFVSSHSVSLCQSNKWHCRKGKRANRVPKQRM